MMIDESTWPYHLRTDAEPLSQCDACERKSWAEDNVGHGCFMPQPNGDRCSGTMQPTEAFLCGAHRC